MELKRLGTVLHINTANNSLIVGSGKITDKIIKKRVIDKEVKDIGIVYDIFGPVESPYIIVKLNKNVKKVDNLKGAILYIQTKSKK